MKLKVHLVFGGSCEEAFATYKELFNGEIVFVFRKGDYGEMMQVAEEEKNKIGHMVMQAAQFSLQGEDADAGAPVATGTTKLVLEFLDLAKLQHVFQVLSKNGTIVAPLEKTCYSEMVGEVIDKFGTRWFLMMVEKGCGA